MCFKLSRAHFPGAKSRKPTAALLVILWQSIWHTPDTGSLAIAAADATVPLSVPFITLNVRRSQRLQLEPADCCLMQLAIDDTQIFVQFSKFRIAHPLSDALGHE